jgi:cytochrome P450
LPARAYDLQSESYFANPYPTYALMRAEDPVYVQPETGIRYLTRYDDVLSLCRDPRVSARRSGLFLNQDTSGCEEEVGVVRRFLEPWLLFLDAPDHTRIRSIMT